jgi:cysteine-rich repeat protein
MGKYMKKLGAGVLWLALFMVGVGCTIITGAFRSSCGDGFLQEGEACDDGNIVGDDGCEADCSLPACGDHIQNKGELCLFGPTPVGTNPNDIELADLNRDGLLDMIVANQGSNNLSVFLGQGDGFFEPPTTVGTGDEPNEVTVVDLNKDNLLDLAIPNGGSGNISIFLGNGDGTFQGEQLVGAGTNPIFIAAGKLNGDDFVDLAVANFDSDNINI